MADNFLERREREIREGGGAATFRKASPSLETLLLRNRSHREYDQSYLVHSRQLEAIIRVNTMTASGMNAQPLRFKAVDSKTPGFETLRGIRVGAALPGGGVEVKAGGFIAVCSEVAENPIVDIDLGIALQSMSLKAVELGLNALIIRGFDKAKVQDDLNLGLEVLAILAIGKGVEKIQLKEAAAGDSLRYFRKDGIHFVPKLSLKEIML